LIQRQNRLHQPCINFVLTLFQLCIIFVSTWYQLSCKVDTELRQFVPNWLVSTLYPYLYKSWYKVDTDCISWSVSTSYQLFIKFVCNFKKKVDTKFIQRCYKVDKMLIQSWDKADTICINLVSTFFQLCMKLGTQVDTVRTLYQRCFNFVASLYSLCINIYTKLNTKLVKS
jgi:hypothetical protein